ncbi:MAG TPA: hypothetical protein VF622_08925 [Segetibacter sp.]|jgi:hypothetical protein
MKTKLHNHYEAFVAVAIMLVFFTAAFLCLTVMTNFLSHVNDGLHSSLSQADKYAASLLPK